MRLGQLRDFIAILDAGGIRAAARRLGVSQPALTKSVRQLEEELHVQLLQRTPRGVVATRPGRTFASRARAIDNELRKAREELAGHAGALAGSVAVGAGPLPSVMLVPEAIARFRARHPSAEVRVVEGSTKVLLPLLADESLDFTISQKPVGGGGSFEFRPLLRTELAIVGRRGHPLRDAGHLARLQQASWLMFSQPGSSGAMVEQMFVRAGLPVPQPFIHCESYAAALALIAKTDTLGLFDPRVLREPFARGYLEVIRVDAPAPGFTLGLVTRAGVPLTRAAAAMVRAVRSVAKELAIAGAGSDGESRG